MAEVESNGTGTPSPSRGHAKPPRHLRIAVILAAWFLLSFTVYMSTGSTTATNDSVPASLLPVSVLLDGSVLLNRFAEEERRRSPDAYWLHETRFGTASTYPVAAGVLSIPIYAIPVLYKSHQGTFTPEEWREFAVVPLQKISGAVFAALSVAVFWSICTALGFHTVLAIVLTLLFAFGSETFAVSSQGLWQHGPGSLALLSAVRAFLAMKARPRTALLLVGLFLGLAVAIRDNNLFLALPIALAALYLQPPRLWPYLVLPGIAVMAPVLVYNRVVLGSVLGVGAGQIGDLALRNMRGGVPGIFVSPARGIFLYFPASLLALVLVLRRAPTLSRSVLLLALGGCIILAAGLNACYRNWDGGYSFGPRYFTEVQGPILILLGAAMMAGGKRMGVAAFCLVLILPYSIFIQVMGSFSPATMNWNSIPDRDESKRLWDWSDNPIFRGVRANLE
jgi:hypothetical protein